MKIDIPNRPALTLASNLLQILGLLFGIGIIVIGFTYRYTIVGYDYEDLNIFTLFLIFIGGLVWMNFAVWGELLGSLKSMEQVQIHIINKLNDIDSIEDEKENEPPSATGKIKWKKFYFYFL